KARARSIAKALSDSAKWHSHGAGISADVLTKELKLRIDDLADKPGQHKAVADYQLLLEDYMMRRGHSGVVHMRGLYTPYHVHEV
ncbi:MAG: hypothetical protein AAB092_00445, partial [Chloroflexota bacterium]